MSTLSVDTLSIDTIQGKTTAGTIAMPSGTVVQVAQREVGNSGFTTTTSETYTDITNFYVDITPKFSNSIIIFDTTITCNINDSSAYAHFRVVDSNNSDAQIHTGGKCGGTSYATSNNSYFEDVPIRATDANCGTTSTMRLQLQAGVFGNTDNAHTFSINWSSTDMRTLTAIEIKA
jgi:hypothetical protein